MSTTWKIEQKRIGPPVHWLYSGVVPVGSMSYNPARSKGDGPENTYAWQLTLPGRARAGHTETEDQARVETELAFREWCEKAYLTQT